MGTSVSQPSPRSKEWREVKSEYLIPNLEIQPLIGKIVHAIGPDPEKILVDEAVSEVLCQSLEFIKETSKEGNKFIEKSNNPYFKFISVGLNITKESLVENKLNSLYGEVAVLGAGEIFIETVGKASQDKSKDYKELIADINGYIEENKGIQDIGLKFIEKYYARMLKYYISRDIDAYIGNMNFPTISSENDLFDSIDIKLDGLFKKINLREEAIVLEANLKQKGLNRKKTKKTIESVIRKVNKEFYEREGDDE